jgi:hypothetical protein
MINKQKILKLAKTNALIIFYLLQILFIFMYIEPDLQQFVYVRF